MAAARPAFSSASIPKRCLKILSMSFLSSALAGTETTILPSFLPASTILLQSLWEDCAKATPPPSCPPSAKTKSRILFISHPIDCLFPEKPAGRGGPRLPYLVNFLLRLVFVFVILLQRQEIFGRDHAEFPEPLSVDVQTTRSDSHGSGKNLLTVSSEQPVHEHFGRVGVRLVFENHQVAVAAADVETFLRDRQRNHRQSGLDERKELGVGDARSHRDFPASKTFGENA